MNDELQQTSPLQEDPPMSNPIYSIPPQHQKSKKKTFLIIGVALAILCLCALISIAISSTSTLSADTERAPIESVLDAYMRSMADKDVNNAYALLSPSAQRRFSILTLEEMLEGNNYRVFEGYQSLTLSTLKVSTAVITTPGAPQAFARTIGVINFIDSTQGSFEGTLERVGDEWMIDGIYVTVPPDKLR